MCCLTYICICLCFWHQVHHDWWYYNTTTIYWWDHCNWILFCIIIKLWGPAIMRPFFHSTQNKHQVKIGSFFWVWECYLTSIIIFSVIFAMSTLSPKLLGMKINKIECAWYSCPSNAATVIRIIIILLVSYSHLYSKVKMISIYFISTNSSQSVPPFIMGCTKLYLYLLIWLSDFINLS